LNRKLKMPRRRKHHDKRCKICNAKLNSYNSDDTCAPCRMQAPPFAPDISEKIIQKYRKN
jgi:hypothetical protein